MMHEINVIIGPGGCFSLFFNVSHAEYMPRAVSTGLRIIGSTSCQICWWLDGHSLPFSGAFTMLVEVCILFSLSISLPLSSSGTRSLPMYFQSTILSLSEDASFSYSLRWGYFIGEKDGSQAIRVLRNECEDFWSFLWPCGIFTVTYICQWWEIIPPKTLKRFCDVSFLLV